MRKTLAMSCSLFVPCFTCFSLLHWGLLVVIIHAGRGAERDPFRVVQKAADRGAGISGGIPVRPAADYSPQQSRIWSASPAQPTIVIAMPDAITPAVVEGSARDQRSPVVRSFRQTEGGRGTTGNTSSDAVTVAPVGATSNNPTGIPTPTPPYYSMPLCESSAELPTFIRHVNSVFAGIKSNRSKSANHKNRGSPVEANFIVQMATLPECGEICRQQTMEESDAAEGRFQCHGFSFTNVRKREVAINSPAENSCQFFDNNAILRSYIQEAEKTSSTTPTALTITTLPGDFTSSTTYFERVCLAIPSECSQSAFAFELYPGQVLYPRSAAGVVEQVSVDERKRCLDFCLSKPACKSVNYHTENGTCQVLNSTWRMLPGGLEIHDEFDHYENTCAREVSRCSASSVSPTAGGRRTRIDFLVTKRVDFDEDNFDILSTQSSAMSIRTCMKECVESGSLNCRSFLYSNATNQCVMSTESYEHYGGENAVSSTSNIIPSTLFDLYEPFCLDEGIDDGPCANDYLFERIPNNRPNHQAISAFNKVYSNISLEDCLDACLREKTCHSFTYSARNAWVQRLDCRLFSLNRKCPGLSFEPDSGGFLLTSDSTVDYYELACKRNDLLQSNEDVQNEMDLFAADKGIVPVKTGVNIVSVQNASLPPNQEPECRDERRGFLIESESLCSQATTIQCLTYAYNSRSSDCLLSTTAIDRNSRFALVTQPNPNYDLYVLPLGQRFCYKTTTSAEPTTLVHTSTSSALPSISSSSVNVSEEAAHVTASLVTTSLAPITSTSTKVDSPSTTTAIQGTSANAENTELPRSNAKPKSKSRSQPKDVGGKNENTLSKGRLRSTEKYLGTSTSVPLSEKQKSNHDHADNGGKSTVVDIDVPLENEVDDESGAEQSLTTSLTLAENSRKPSEAPTPYRQPESGILRKGAVSVEVECLAHGANITLRTNGVKYTGAVYAPERYQQCRIEVVEREEFAIFIPRPTHFDGCNALEDEETGRFSVALVLSNDGVLPYDVTTKDDLFYSVECDYSAFLRHRKGFVSGSKFAGGHLTNNGVEPAFVEYEDGGASVSLNILRNGEPVHDVYIGERLTATIDSTVDPSKLLVLNCNATRAADVGHRPGTPTMVKLIQQGCSLLPRVIGDMGKGRSGRLEAPFTVFRMDGSDEVDIACTVLVCRHRCNFGSGPNCGSTHLSTKRSAVPTRAEQLAWSATHKSAGEKEPGTARRRVTQAGTQDGAIVTIGQRLHVATTYRAQNHDRSHAIDDSLEANLKPATSQPRGQQNWEKAGGKEEEGMFNSILKDMSRSLSGSGDGSGGDPCISPILVFTALALIFLALLVVVISLMAKWCRKPPSSLANSIYPTSTELNSGHFHIPRVERYMA